jgi:oxygen-independent coproporphyrinogen III oxidase
MVNQKLRTKHRGPFTIQNSLFTIHDRMETLGIYVQVPFCASKCSFCNFTSKVGLAGALDVYCHALEQEIACPPAFLAASEIPPKLLALPVDTIYIGGGTPSVLGVERLGRIVSALRGRFSPYETAEFTLEVTPGSADDDLLKALPRLGVDRLSIGAQSFNDGELRPVGRLHSAAATRDLVGRARRAGFKNISLDLIAGLPYQSESSWSESLHQAMRLAPEHISVYLFEVDEASRLGSEVLRHGTRYGAAQVPSDDFLADAYESACALLFKGGYVHYEISNFALPGFESRHNRRYWRLQPYLGLGAGAHSFDGYRRWSNETAPEVYQDKLARGESPIGQLHRLSPEEQLEEFFFLGLRQHQGVDLTMARRRWGRDLVARWQPKINALAADGWLEANASRVRLAQRASLVSNEVFQEFLV